MEHEGPREQIQTRLSDGPLVIKHSKLAKQGLFGRISGVVSAAWPPTI